MFLSKLKIQGFKSFPDKTELNFTDGVTSIVGPNGCGKTNIVDAIRWVLGEQKASTLRSTKMEEVIFNGTKKKKPLNFCEATLTIENNKELLPIEYETLEITRRYFRNGDSEYYINKNQCRLKDIHEMFVDTGMSSGAYSVIELKMIESILSQNPTDRRTMIDEASGINNYNKQRAASTRRLISTKSDMERIYDIMSEVETNVKKLKLQMKRYERHKVLTEDLLASEILLHKKSIDLLDEKLNPLIESRKSMINSKDVLLTDLSKKEKKLDEAQNKFEKTRLKMELFQKNIKEIEDNIIKINQDIIVATEQVGHSNNRIDQSNKEITTKTAQLSAIQIEIKSMEKKISQLIPKIDKKQFDYNKLDENFQKLCVESDLIEKKITSFQDQHSQIINKINLIKNNIDSNERLISHNKNLIKNHRNEVQEAQKLYNESKISLDKLKINLSSEKKDKDKNSNELVKNESSISKIEQNLISLENHKNKLSKDLLKYKNKLDFYNKLITSKDGASNGNEYIIKKQDNYRKFILGRLEDLISCPKNLVEPLSMAIGKFSDYLVINKLSEAKQIVDFYQSKKMSFNFIILDQIPKSKKKISTDTLLAKIEFSPKLADFLYNLIGDFRILKESEISTNKKNNFIFSDSSKILSNGILRVNPNKYESAMYTKHEILEIEQKINKISKVDLIKLDKEISKENDKKNRLISSSLKIKELIKINEISLGDIKIEIEKYKFLIKEHDNKQRAINVNLNILEKEIIGSAIKSKELNQQATNLNKELKDLDREKIKISRDSSKAKNKILESRQKLERSKINLIEIINNKNSINNRINDYKQNEKEISNEITRYKEDVDKSKTLIKNLVKSNNLLKKELKEFYKKEKSLNKEVGSLQNSYSKEYQTFQSLQLEIKEKRKVTDSSKDNLNDLNIKIEKINSEISIHKNSLSEISGQNISKESVEKFNSFNIEEISNNINKIKLSIDRIGPINMDVDSQHQAEIERFDFLNNQYNDLVESETYLQETISSLDKEARKLFTSTFKEIQKNFSKTYNMFYQGGEASIELKGDDVLDAEIIIKATPPGKSSQSLRMLSGGEKAITAISLLFAIYLVKPSPFCILDEVDAPLDDINIKRFNEVIKQFSTNSQFIIVTHNKLTMEASDYLYGVTQQQKGISKIVSVNLNDIDERFLV